MTDYTPTTEQVIDQYARREPPRYGTVSSRTAELIRWLDQVRADAWEAGRIDGQINAENDAYGTRKEITNPYRQE